MGVHPCTTIVQQHAFTPKTAQDYSCTPMRPFLVVFALSVLAACGAPHVVPQSSPDAGPFDAGTVAVAREAARLTGDGKLLSVAGGGDTVAALNHAGVADDFSYVSTAGGAFLEWLEGKPLPGVEVLRKR